jgi:hypothetical protein
MVDLRLWGRPGAGVAIVDPDSLPDLVAFWNIRATGADIVPIPIGYPEMLEESLLSWVQSHPEEDWVGSPRTTSRSGIPPAEPRAASSRGAR